MGKKIFIIAGESSGDLHGKNLVKALLEKDPHCEIKAYGGQLMQDAGATIVRNYEAYAFMGFFEVAKNIGTVLSNIKTTQELIIDYLPDIIIFIDFPGFNLRVAKALRSKLKDTKFYYYIAPQVWAWKSNRVHAINRLMDDVFVILPFEKDFFANFGYSVKYVGHPLLDEIKAGKRVERQRNLIAVLPGSRKQEIQKMLPHFAELAGAKQEYIFEISTMPHIARSFYQKQLKDHKYLKNLFFSKRPTYELLSSAQLAIVTSGTATLETALLDTPQLVAYKTSPISYWIAKRIVNIKYISLVNLVLDKLAIPELIQDELNLKTLVATLDKINKSQSIIRTDYQLLKERLGQGGASKSVAKTILNS